MHIEKGTLDVIAGPRVELSCSTSVRLSHRVLTTFYYPSHYHQSAAVTGIGHAAVQFNQLDDIVAGLVRSFGRDWWYGLGGLLLANSDQRLRIHFQCIGDSDEAAGGNSGAAVLVAVQLRPRDANSVRQFSLREALVAAERLDCATDHDIRLGRFAIVRRAFDSSGIGHR